MASRRSFDCADHDEAVIGFAQDDNFKGMALVTFSRAEQLRSGSSGGVVFPLLLEKRPFADD